MAKLDLYLTSLAGHIPSGQFGRYLLVGIWNTVFGYSTFALLTVILNRYISAGYILASLLSSILNISVSFLGYKWFVFKTKGNYLQEWIRCLIIYSSSILLGLALLPITVFAVISLSGNSQTAPYIAGALVMGVQIILSFIGHKKFSFKHAHSHHDGDS